MSEALAPLTPPDCDLRDFHRMMIDIPRLFASEFNATDDDTAWRFGVTLWFKSWQQIPAGSLPDDDGQLAKLVEIGRDLKTWRRAKETALRGWTKRSDGRLYHRTVAEFVLEAWIEKLLARLSSGAGNAKRYGYSFDPSLVNDAIEAASRLLHDIAPRSKAADKLKRRQSRSAPGGSPGDLPPGDAQLPPGAENLPPGGSGCPIGTPTGIPPGSQETETGTGILKKEEDPPPAPPPKSEPRRFDEDRDFAAAWTACTDAMRRRSDSREKTWRIWRTAAQRAGGGELLLRAVQRYVAEDADLNRPGSTAGPGFHRWLNDGKWEHWLGGNAPAADQPPHDPWSMRRLRWDDDRYWDRDWGPRPDRDGCQAPWASSSKVIELRRAG